MSLASIKKPGRKDWEYVRGDSFQRTFTVKQGGQPFDFTGWSVAAQIRERPNADILESFTATVVAPATDGRLRIQLTTDQTRSLPANARWDLQVSLDADPDNNTHTLLEGFVCVKGDITQ
jgi:hypothetical protein